MFLYDFLPWKKNSSSSIIEHRLFLQDGNYYLNLWKIIKEKFYNKLEENSEEIAVILIFIAFYIFTKEKRRH